MFSFTERKIEYPPDFILAVKEACPDAPEIHYYLEIGDRQVRFELDRLYTQEIQVSPQQIIFYLENEKYEELKTRAERALRISELANQAFSIVCEQEAQNSKVG